MIVGDESAENIDLKENSGESGEESFMLRLTQKSPLLLCRSLGLSFCRCCLAANNDLGDGMSAALSWPCGGRVPREKTVVAKQSEMNVCGRSSNSTAHAKKKETREAARQEQKVIALGSRQANYSGKGTPSGTTWRAVYVKECLCFAQ